MYGAARDPVAYHLELYRYWSQRPGRAAKRKAKYHYAQAARAQSRAAGASARAGTRAARREAAKGAGYRRSSVRERLRQAKARRQARRQALLAKARKAKGDGLKTLFSKWRKPSGSMPSMRQPKPIPKKWYPKKIGANPFTFPQFEPSTPAGVQSGAVEYEGGAFQTYMTSGEGNQMVEEGMVPAPAEMMPEEGMSPWLMALGALALGGLGYTLLRRRKGAGKKPKGKKRKKQSAFARGKESEGTKLFDEGRISNPRNRRRRRR